MNTVRLNTAGPRQYRSTMYVFADGTNVSSSRDIHGKYATATARLAGHLQPLTINRITAARILWQNRRTVTDKAIFS